MYFKNFLCKSRCKLNITWVDKNYEFYNRSMKIYLTHNEKSVFTERFVKTLKN